MTPLVYFIDLFLVSFTDDFGVITAIRIRFVKVFALLDRVKQLVDPAAIDEFHIIFGRLAPLFKVFDG